MWKGKSTVFVNKHPVAEHTDYAKHRAFLKGLVRNLYLLLYGVVPVSLNDAAEVLRKKHRIRIHADGAWEKTFDFAFDGLASEDEGVRQETADKAAELVAALGI